MYPYQCIHYALALLFCCHSFATGLSTPWHQNINTQEREKYAKLIQAIEHTQGPTHPVWPHPQVFYHQLFPLPQDQRVSAYQLYQHFKSLPLDYSEKSPLPVSALYFLVNIACNQRDFAQFQQLAKAFAKTNPYRLYESIPFVEKQFIWPYADYSPYTILQKGGVCTDRSYWAAMILKLRGIPCKMVAGEDHFWLLIHDGKNRWEAADGRGHEIGSCIDPRTGGIHVPKAYRALRSYQQMALGIPAFSLLLENKVQEGLSEALALHQNYAQDFSFTLSTYLPMYIHSRYLNEKNAASSLENLKVRFYQDTTIEHISAILFANQSE